MTKYFANHPGVGWIAAYEGFYDLAILFWAKDVYEFKEMYEEVLNEYGTLFQDHFISVATNIYHFKHNYLFDSKDYSEALIGGRPSAADLDELDMKILKMLADDGRKTTLDIGREAGSSPNTVKYRIKKLLESGVIVAFNAMLDTSVLGYQHYKVFLKLQNMNKEMKKKLIEYLRCNRNTIYITDAIGLADFEFEIMVKSSQELHTMLRELKSEFPTVIRDCSPGLVFKEHRINYLPFGNDLASGGKALSK
jgi:DNA-binding Lrp family transcriptional regulator